MESAKYYLAAVVSLWLLFATAAHAQTQKIGYVNTDVILSNIPEYQGLDQQLRLISQEWQKEIERMDREIERLKEDLRAKEVLYTDDVREQKQQEINRKERQRRRYREQKFGPDGEYYQKQKELLQPIQRKVFDAINTVARRDGFDFVFDRASNPEMLYSRQEWNLTEEVLIELGIEPNGVSN